MTQDLSKDEIKSIARDARQCNGCQWDSAGKCILTGDCHYAAKVRSAVMEEAGAAPRMTLKEFAQPAEYMAIQALVHATDMAPIESALTTQVGGGHYKDMAIQPVEFIHKNGLGFLEGCVVKRLCRWRKKDGVQDLRKAIHEIELLIEMEEVRFYEDGRAAAEVRGQTTQGEGTQ